MKILKSKDYSYWNVLKIPFSVSRINSIVIIVNALVDVLIPSIQVVAVSKFINSTIQIVQGKAGLSTVYMLLYLYRLEPLLAFILLIIFVPMSLSQYIKSVIYLKMADSSAPHQRKYLYYEKCICDNQYFNETYLLGAYSFFDSKFKKV